MHSPFILNEHWITELNCRWGGQRFPLEYVLRTGKKERAQQVSDRQGRGGLSNFPTLLLSPFSETKLGVARMGLGDGVLEGGDDGGPLGWPGSRRPVDLRVGPGVVVK